MLDIVVRLRDEAGQDAQVRAIDAEAHAERKDQATCWRGYEAPFTRASFAAFGGGGRAPAAIAAALFTECAAALCEVGEEYGTSAGAGEDGCCASADCAAGAADAAAARGVPDERVVARLRHNTVVSHHQPPRRRHRVRWTEACFDAYSNRRARRLERRQPRGHACRVARLLALATFVAMRAARGQEVETRGQRRDTSLLARTRTAPCWPTVGGAHVSQRREPRPRE